jgi:hypothetical protein
MPRVFNIKNIDHITENMVYIGRPSKWGNPFKIDQNNSRLKVIEQFRNMVLSDEKFIKEIRKELIGKDLLCF